MLNGIISNALQEGKRVTIRTTVGDVSYDVEKVVSESQYFLCIETRNETVYLLPNNIVSVEVSDRGGRVAQSR